MIIDGSNLIMGRLASKVAKLALLGEKIDIVNCENIVITGDKKEIFAKYGRFRAMGPPHKGPFMPRMPDRFVRRAIKRMLPYKNERGKTAFKNIMCHIGMPDEFKDQTVENIEGVDVSKMKSLKYVYVREICKKMGAKL